MVACILLLSCLALFLPMLACIIVLSWLADIAWRASNLSGYRNVGLVTLLTQRLLCSKLLCKSEGIPNVCHCNKQAGAQRACFAFNKVHHSG